MTLAHTSTASDGTCVEDRRNDPAAAPVARASRHALASRAMSPLDPRAGAPRGRDAPPAGDAAARHPSVERAHAIVRVLKKHRARLARKLEAVRGDLAEAERAPLYRRYGQALLVYIRHVPARAARVTIPDPADTSHSLDIALDPMLNAQKNAARYFKKAAKAERALEEIPPRIAAVEREVEEVAALVARAGEALRSAEHDPVAPLDEKTAKALEAALASLPPALRSEVEPAAKPATTRVTAAAIASGQARAPSGRLQPKRFRSAEGWDVLIGRNNEGNDYLTLHLARPEDYWFHVHGCPGSHVVLRRGKGKNEPSKKTIEEVAAWAAFHSQARTAGKVPVIVTQKKYVRKPRKAPPGTVVCEREKTVMVRPVEPKVEIGET